MNPQELTKLLRLHSMLLRREDRTRLPWRRLGQYFFLQVDEYVHCDEDWTTMETGIYVDQMKLFLTTTHYNFCGCVKIELFDLDAFLHEQLTLEEVT